MRQGKARTTPSKAAMRIPAGKVRKLPGGTRSAKLAAQSRKLLGKHYASKYQTMRRG